MSGSASHVENTLSITTPKGISTRLMSSPLPLVIEPEDKTIQLSQLLDILQRDHAFFKQSLLKHGGLLFRNFPIQNEDDFAAVIQSLNTGKCMDYIGGDSPRTKIKEGIYTSTEAPPSMKIPLHNELSYIKTYPSHIYFYCAIAPEARGETIIADSRKVYQSIDEEVKKRFIEKKLKYISRYFYKSPLMRLINKFQTGHKTWIDVFETDDKQEVERKCRKHEISFKWNQDDWLEISQIRPAVMPHPQTGEMAWFNQAHLFDFNPKFLGWKNYIGAKILYCKRYMRLHEIFFADNTPIPREDLYHILDVLDANTIYFPWQKGDVLALDNILAMHGRSPFKGKRRVLTAMTG
jgi:alpha-ketoglutarate-dependent taurine dioxygenase